MISKEDLETLEQVLTNPAIIEAENSKVVSMAKAVAENDLETLQFLLPKLEQGTINAPCMPGALTALHIACYTGQLAEIFLLEKHGASMEKSSLNGSSPRALLKNLPPQYEKYRKYRSSIMPKMTQANLTQQAVAHPQIPGPIIISLQGTSLLPKERELLAKPQVGGLVLYRENWEKNDANPKAVLIKLIQEIRSINPNIIIMVDHEGGKVWRFEKGFTKLPAAKEFGKHYMLNREAGLKFAFDQGYIMASELLDCGINMSLAPVLDLDGKSDVIGKLERAFHTEPKIVSEIAESFIRGMNKAGMPATAKHFPGHGSCELDSHFAKPVDPRTKKELEQDWIPFKKLVEKKLLGAMMPAHVTYPAVDAQNPAGFSPKWIQGILRSWGFEGVVMSDCLSMQGADVGETLARLTAAQTAGCDFLMFTHQHNKLCNYSCPLIKFSSESHLNCN